MNRDQQMRIGVLTSGGDAPGMNAAIRAAVRCGTERGVRMFGVHRGFDGLIEGDVVPLDNRAVGGIIERGGTILRTARSPTFLSHEGQSAALDTICSSGLDGLIIVGGNGSLAGADWLHKHGVRAVGIPASIDNDVPGTDMAIGVDSALNTVVECLNRIRDTAIAHERAFVVEVMGRTSGYIALMGGLAGGAEVVLLPEIPGSLGDIVQAVSNGVHKGKRHSILVVAEGFVPTDKPFGGRSPGPVIADALERDGTVETRLTILGHLQRGGSPTAYDRILACRFGQAAVSQLADGGGGVMTGLVGGKILPVALSALGEECHNVDLDLYRLVNVLAH